MRATLIAAVAAGLSSSAILCPSVRAETAGEILAQMKSTSKNLADLDAKTAENHAKTEANDAEEKLLVEEYNRDIKLGLQTDEAVVNCLSGQWDGTQKTDLYVPDPPQGLTQEQVIERYKSSGKPTGPQTVKTKEPPPPPTSK